MSNILAIEIEGTIPFDAGNNAALIQMIGDISLPANGIHMKYDLNPQMVDNEEGGQTAMYGFRLSGRESVSLIFLDRFAKLVKEVGGTIDTKQVIDLDG